MEVSSSYIVDSDIELKENFLAAKKSEMLTVIER